MHRSRRNSSRIPHAGRGAARLGVVLCLVGCCAIGAVTTGCTATLEPGYAEAGYVPPDITVYPHTYYDGHVVYFVGDRYYYRGPHDDWVYYRSAPAPLIERRRRIHRERPYVQEAPVVRRHHHHHGDERREHEERRIEPSVRAPEPATRVR